MTFKGRKGSMQAVLRKQKLNTASSTTLELVAVDDALPLVIWTPLFLKEQGYTLSENIVYQDNKSAILLEKNGRRSAGKQTQALNIRYFMINNDVERGNVQIRYCPTDKMVGDYMSKALQGMKFNKFRD